MDDFIEAGGAARLGLYGSLAGIVLFLLWGFGHCASGIESRLLTGNLVAELPFGNTDDGRIEFEVVAPAMTHRLEVVCNYRAPKGSVEKGRVALELTGPNGRRIYGFRDRFSHTRRSFTFKPTTTGTYVAVNEVLEGCDYPIGFVRVNDHRLVSPLLQYVPYLY